MKILTAFFIAFTTPALACKSSDLLPNTRAALPSPQILAIGSSSTAGVGAGSKGTSYPNQISRALMGTGIAPTVVARGIGGEKASGALARMNREIKETKPDLVLWQVGTNDANARLDPKDVARTIRTGVANEEMAELVDTVGASLCIPVIDRYEEMRDAGDGLPQLLARDKFHMSALGHRVLAESIAQEIRCALNGACEGQ